MMWTKKICPPVLLAGWLSVCLSIGQAQAGFAHRPEVKAWLATQDELGFSQQQVVAMLQAAQRQPRVLPTLAKAPERTWVWSDYRQRLLSAQRIKAGRKFMRKHAELLSKIEAHYGVPAEYIAAIAGVETNYGRTMGRYPTLGTLATLAFEHPRRQTFFRKELAQFLRLSYQHQLDPLAIKGSPAGAIGMGQFMPSSYQAYAVDGDGDGQVDLLTNTTDSLTSIANYLRRHGWQAGVPIMLPVTISAQSLPEISKKPGRGGVDLHTWHHLGVRWHGQPVPQSSMDDIKYRLYAFTTHADPEYLLATGNFYVITRYNHSLWYARLVAELAQSLGQQ
ncbi:MAG: lytic murein transglycosylase B [Gammaproteobacteria bacterium]|jgi:membrane-bound lytic murein transglycosylase B|nr:lytic murein transglycosylase B [Gammaproteobacteria bacterium]